jgi:hypothetical protein
MNELKHFYMYTTKSIAVDATAIDRINDLVNEINQFWIEVTGEGLPQEQIDELQSMHPDDLMTKLQGLKMSEADNFVPYYGHVVDGIKA